MDEAVFLLVLHSTLALRLFLHQHHRALNREFFRFSVGGLYDVAEIKGEWPLPRRPMLAFLTTLAPTRTFMTITHCS
jgi:hypothetical protein